MSEMIHRLSKKLIKWSAVAALVSTDFLSLVHCDAFSLQRVRSRHYTCLTSQAGKLWPVDQRTPRALFLPPWTLAALSLFSCSQTPFVADPTWWSRCRLHDWQHPQWNRVACGTHTHTHTHTHIHTYQHLYNQFTTLHPVIWGLFVFGGPINS